MSHLSLFFFLFYRAGELTNEELERLVTIIQSPTQYKIPNWFLNRQKDIVDGKYSQILANGLESKFREDLERLKKIRAHRGLRHYWGLRVRGQHTKTTGRKGRTVGVSKKKSAYSFFLFIFVRGSCGMVFPAALLQTLLGYYPPEAMALGKLIFRALGTPILRRHRKWWLNYITLSTLTESHLWKN